jgi:hypothetical protein
MVSRKEFGIAVKVILKAASGELVVEFTGITKSPFP